MRHALNMLCGLALVTAAGGVANAAAPCGGIKVSEGSLTFGDRMTLDGSRSQEGTACIKAVAEQLLKMNALQTITVAARVPNDKSMREKGMETANYVADKLAEFGLQRSMVSTVVPMARPDEKDAIYFAYIERRSARSVAQIQTVSGRVLAGNKLGQLRDAGPGQLLSGSDYLETGKGSVALLKLLDDSHLYVFENSALRVGQVDIDGNGKRNVQVQMLRGEAAVLASERDGPFYIVTGNAIAGVRGTVFRIAQVDPQKSRVETLGGTGTFGGKTSNIFVPEGKGSRVDHRGTPEEPRSLLVSPSPEWPLMGRATPGDLLRWQPVGEAHRYRIELAKNAQFTESWLLLESTVTKVLVPDTLSPGKWFWRVTALDVDGFVGYPSKIYAFTVPAPL